ncbi:cytochrome P450 [Bimuria novae-zelandiae CBS 107.79]|uniref:Cytochrome P450 n=1 Tax=Bimuria novae-zelandiae CBS 107.79 TaxID=1447943 RepID=A0A6A5URN7_9PLEO|nr:cytochrome P450 [Bimuria novae-zelandiae CBS 107.79]
MSTPLLWILYSLYKCIYNLYFHPLAHIPGPFWARATPIPYIVGIKNGTMVPWIYKIHQKYGEVVRVAPFECSFISAETAWQDIYSSTIWYSVPYSGVFSMLLADDASHARQRTSVSHGFSDRALRDQEPLVQSLIDLLIQWLGEFAEGGNEEIDISKWYNYAMFDIDADLLFGESLHCLRDRSGGIRAMQRMYSVVAYYDYLVSLFKDNSAALRLHMAFGKAVNEKVHQRLELGADRPDIFSAVIKNQGVSDKGLTAAEMVQNSLLILTAGSETTATLLSGLTCLILKNPRVYDRLTREIRDNFKSADQVTFVAVEKLEYTLAVIQEALRYYPPSPTSFPRVVPKGVDRVSRYYLSEDTTVYVSQHATYHSARNFVEPDSFVPERGLNDTRKSLRIPYSFGPGNCLGKYLAHAEMRVILAKVPWHLDHELRLGMHDWFERGKHFITSVKR